MSTLLPLVVTDFDGTLARLVVDWSGLRASFGVRSIDELWASGIEAFEPVADAETAAAHTAPAIGPCSDALAAAEGVAVLTSNSERAAAAFLVRQPTLATRVVLVVGRETLGGPKTEFARFRTGFERCLAALGATGAPAVSYLGDQDYELEFARRLGADVHDARELSAGPP